MAFSLTVWLPGLPLFGAEVTITRTNWSERWITNVIDVRMPENHFVNVYRTNWVTQLRTNIVDVYATNWTLQRLTNQIAVSATWTNHVTAYHTNWDTRTLTNLVALNLVRTNILDRCRTNWSNLNLTNWQTVVLFKTNWVNQPVTNVVQIDLPKRAVAPAPAPVQSVVAREPAADMALLASGSGWPGPLAIQASRTARPPVNDVVEVQLKLRRTGATAAPPEVRQWRIEREDGAVLLFGQDQDFTRQLPLGKYKVEAKMNVQGDNPPLTVRGTLSVTTDEAVVQPRLLVKK